MQTYLVEKSAMVTCVFIYIIPLLGTLAIYHTNSRFMAFVCIFCYSCCVNLIKVMHCVEQRDAATAPNMGDRVPYVIVKAAKGAKVIILVI